MALMIDAVLIPDQFGKPGTLDGILISVSGPEGETVFRFRRSVFSAGQYMIYYIKGMKTGSRFPGFLIPHPACVPETFGDGSVSCIFIFGGG
jgi:hypothetical protein